uniref:Uncharacterized protein n=1 Tax=Stegastes partitus TaxID=144197 RepID=A0A3B4ZXJ8_9TELE
MSEVSKRRKVDVENRQLNNKWTNEFAFILPSHTNAKPLCLICQMTVAVCKVATIKWHYDTKHASFSAAFSCWKHCTERQNCRFKVVLFNRLNNLDDYNYFLCGLFSVAVDVYTDATDTAQLAVFVRYFNGELFKKELLCLLPLKSNTTGEVIYTSIKSFFEIHSLELNKINLLVTDSRPSMIGRERGLASRLKSDHPTVNSLHCIIHQTVLCTNGEMKGAMDTMIKIVNHIRSTSSLQHRLFKLMLQEQDAQYSDRLQHNDVRRLSRGQVLQCFFALRKEIAKFLSSQKTKKAEELSQFMQDQESVAVVAFLCDITRHLNQLNLQLQGGDVNVGELFEKENAFQTTLGVFVADIEGKQLHFPTLHDVPTNGIVLSHMVALLKNLSENFRSQFHNFKIPQQLLMFVRNPFAVAATGSCPTEAKNAVAKINEGTFQAKFREERLCEFWAHSVHRYPNSKRLAIYMLTMFRSTYICESGFSVMNPIKDKKRNRLTDSQSQPVLAYCIDISQVILQ